MEVGQRLHDLLAGLAHADDDRRLGGELGIGGPGQDRQGSGVARRGTDRPLQADNGLDVVVQHIGPLEVFPNGVDKVLELVGTTTLLDSLRSTKPKGIVCMTGMVGDQWLLKDFSPMGAIPTAVSLTTYAGGAADFIRTPLQVLVQQIEKGALRPQVGQVFSLDQIVAAHRCMEENRAGGKIVVLT